MSSRTQHLVSSLGLAGLCAAPLLLMAAGCSSDAATGPGATPGVASPQLASAFAAAPLSADKAITSWDASAGAPGWAPRSDHFEGGFMGGGLGALFVGKGFALGFGQGRTGDAEHLPEDCDRRGGGGRMDCPEDNVGGLSITRSVVYRDAGGSAQAAFDALTTNTIDETVSVSGTVTRPDSDVTTIDLHSERSVTGLKPGSEKRTVSGTSAGKETTVGRDSIGDFTAIRSVADTTDDVSLPVPAYYTPTFPTSGRIVRTISASFAYAGRSARTSLRREVITYDGSATASVVITQDGSTKTCTLPLPNGKLNCP